MSAPQQPVTDNAPALPDADPASDDAVVEAVEVEPRGAGEAGGSGDDLLVREGDVAGDYLERLLDILDVDGDIDLDVEGDRASVAIVGGRLDDLIGPDGATLEALQELTRLAVAQSTGVRSRLMLDVGGYRAERRADLTTLAGETARRVSSSGQPERLSPMNPFERKVVHDVIASVSGVHSESEGEEPNRRVVVLPDR
ncbi:protein jag [Blastococcus sp. HT6-30]|uniref:Jag family protein n=1 Tax=Blastococcus sp. HT6-30 TaxID=3144843 RepID=UPI00321BF573